MGKKKRANVALIRYGEKKTEELRGYADEMKAIVGQLEAVADLMSKSDIDVLNIDGVTKMDRALQLADEFVLKVDVALKREKMKRRHER